VAAVEPHQCDCNWAWHSEEKFGVVRMLESSWQASSSNFLHDAMKGAWLQSILSSPPLVAHELPSQMLENTCMGWWGYINAVSSVFRSTRTGTESTLNLPKNYQNLECFPKQMISVIII